MASGKMPRPKLTTSGQRTASRPIKTPTQPTRQSISSTQTTRKPQRTFSRHKNSNRTLSSNPNRSFHSLSNRTSKLSRQPRWCTWRTFPQTRKNPRFRTFSMRHKVKNRRSDRSMIPRHCRRSVMGTCTSRSLRGMRRRGSMCRWRRMDGNWRGFWLGSMRIRGRRRCLRTSTIGTAKGTRAIFQTTAHLCSTDQSHSSKPQPPPIPHMIFTFIYCFNLSNQLNQQTPNIIIN
mgnify:CR=1 FL=1